MKTPSDGDQSPAALRALARDLAEASKPFANADDRRATWQLMSTTGLFFALLAVMYLLAPNHYVFTLLLAIPAGGLLTRLFALQHDCGHGSFYSSKAANDWTGKVISVLTLTPYDYWRRSHAQHHAGSGNLDRRGIGDVDTLTVREFSSLGYWGRLRYRILRHPLVALVIGPPLYFLVLQRVMFNGKLGTAAILKSIAAHNAVLVMFYGTLSYLLGTLPVLSIALPVVLVGAWIGGALFYVQHQFEETRWDLSDVWDVKVAALKGSSHLQLPRALNWLTCDIAIHHVHHLSSRIPNYHLRDCLEALPALDNIAPKLTLSEALRSARLSLWDETERKLISFRQFEAKYT